MRTALFTGSGASKAIGYPVTRELLPMVRDELRSGELFARTNGKRRDAHCRNELERYLKKLLPGFRKAKNEDLPLITDVFSLVEHAIVAGQALPVGGDADLRRFRDLLK